jgi:citrate synthase
MNTATNAIMGLDDVVVADTRLSEVDGERGRLVIAGHFVEDLAGRVPFEAVCGLLWDGELPDAARLSEIRAALGRARALAFGALPGGGTDAMDGLRASIAALPAREAAAWPDDAIRLTGAIATHVAAAHRMRRGLDPIAPDPERGHAEDLLRMLDGREPERARVDALDAYLCTVCDHGMNASTFAARVVASTGSDVVSAIVAALGALKGPLHGGAPGPVLDMLDAIGTPERAEAWLHAELQAGRRIMGMGHRIYRVRDPRAAALEAAFARLGADDERRALARCVEARATELLAARHPDRPLRANVEFYTAILLEAIGIPRELFTAIFAASRVAGWCAHVREQQREGRLLRPRSRYVGPVPSPAA